ncbi:metallophosphoesterase family protein [Novosphingobium sp. TH158]|uniref:metallophosphoesterase family protein n=1 Tax=Novosphingobium sp. TH158 TaxID=2067455 RepID=UPI000C7ADB7F|nr:metallophosphoesterase family protein [Novosphingobium sp. TH158]PLK26505.1 serine/threonine protein phosphatase [Novosphingobium sp. TH158]
MFKALRSLFASRPEPVKAAIPAGQRVYAVGDIHGRLDLMVTLAEAIEADDRKRGPADTTVILLGDLVDRGPDSAGVITAARMWAEQRRVRFIAGNHEEMFLDSFDSIETLRHFIKYGGKETLLSYPIDPQAYTAAEIEELQALMRQAVPKEDLDFLNGFEDTIRIGDYVFVHAGIHPDLPLEEQRTSQLRWIREPFLSHPGDHGFVVVHGHTITDEAQVLANRIGIDTGAYQSGRLTALGLEGSNRWLIETHGEGTEIAARVRPAE